MKKILSILAVTLFISSASFAMDQGEKKQCNKATAKTECSKNKSKSCCSKKSASAQCSKKSASANKLIERQDRAVLMAPHDLVLRDAEEVPVSKEVSTTESSKAVLAK